MVYPSTKLIKSIMRLGKRIVTFIGLSLVLMIVINFLATDKTRYASRAYVYRSHVNPGEIIHLAAPLFHDGVIRYGGLELQAPHRTTFEEYKPRQDVPLPFQARDAEEKELNFKEGGEGGEGGELTSVEREKLNVSPFIFDEVAEEESLRGEVAQQGVKLISGYLPFEQSFNKYSFKLCRYNSCRFVNNLTKADAIVFAARAIRDHPILDYVRPEGQRWIFYTYDPSIVYYKLHRPDIVSEFNWSITYQLHSSFPLLFGQLRRRSPPVKDYESIYSGKSNATAWFVSHCSTWSKRELYVDRMRKLMDVHIFGLCGDRKCGLIHYRLNDSTLCLPMLSQQYKFYLAFENAFCQDYVSEKFFKLFEDVDVIPVVRGGFDYKKYLPDGIYVDASDFKNPEDLASYLVKLGDNKEEYINMLKRKDRWVAVATQSIHCQVCEVLHKYSNTTTFIPNLNYHYHGEPSYCHEPADL
ncbi:unnamed protein product [Lymnaea stagnalis]|uniref:Fucosyltransferase n=1 Tax=Lymnaea stagnalis TaxID=6523 RepID=A0AAV2HV67_LYMST